MQKYYAVLRGRKVGIFLTWDECQKQVMGFKNAKCKSFTSRIEANNWVKQGDDALKYLEQFENKKIIKVFTDGGSRNHGNKLGQHVKKDDVSAWAYLIQTENRKITGTAGEYGSTNSRMEVLALLNALKKLKDENLNKEPVNFILDSSYVKNAAQDWMYAWSKKNWRKSDGKEIEHRKLWQEIYSLMQNFPKKTFTWVKGHSSNEGNNYVDELLNQTMNKMKNA